MSTKPPDSIDDYIASFPDEVQARLQKIRQAILEMAPEAQETISYQIPAFNFMGRQLIYFAAYKNHISLYPAPRGNEAFKEALSIYQGGKGTVQFPHDQPLPFDLVRRIVEFRMQENIQKARAKAKKG
jgi:uncharacterized protein YdhG (YjbR/CyaY superfamily)